MTGTQHLDHLRFNVVADQVARFALRDHLAGGHHGDVIGQALGLLDVVRRHQDRRARGAQIVDQGPELGADLRIEGVVVEVLHGVDDLAAALADFGPTASARAGVLVDHLVAGSKEQRIAHEAMRRFGADRVLIVGHPYVDVWQAIRPERVGLRQWPVIPRGQDWKTGIAAALGLPHTSTQDIGLVWKHLLSRVRTYADLEPAFSGRVEELVDFVTGP